MVTVYREAGLRFVIFRNDHPPAHVHVMGDGKAKIVIVGAEGAPELDYNDGLKSGDLRKAMRIVAQRQVMLMDRWKDYHG